MIRNVPVPLPQREQYWNELTDLKVNAVYIRLYRDSYGKWLTGLRVLKAVTSSSGIAAWVIWKEYAIVWGVILAASQVADALKDVFPFAKKYRAASEYASTLDNLLIEIQLEWEKILISNTRDGEVMKLLHRLRRSMKEAERRSFPDGLAKREDLVDSARLEADEYLRSRYDVK